MRQLTLATVCMGVLVACGGMQPRQYSPHELRGLEADFDQAWEAAVHVLARHGYDIGSADPTTRIIQTGWLTINPDFSSTIFVTSQEDRYSDCGKPGVGQTFLGKQARLQLSLEPIGAADTGLRIQAFFRTQRYSDVPLWPGRPQGDVECSSRGLLEEEFTLRIKLRTIRDRLERLRRGGP